MSLDYEYDKSVKIISTKKMLSQCFDKLHSQANEIQALIKERDGLRAQLDPEWIEYAKSCIRQVESERQQRDNEYNADKEYR